MDAHDAQDVHSNYPAIPGSFPRAQPRDFRRPENGVRQQSPEVLILEILRHAERGVKRPPPLHLVHPRDGLFVFADVAQLQQRGRLRQRAGLVELARAEWPHAAQHRMVFHNMNHRRIFNINNQVIECNVI